MVARVTNKHRGPPQDPQGETEDVLVEGILDEALEGFDDLPPELMQAVRDSLGDLLAAHPSGQRLLRQMKADPIVAKSTDLVQGDAADTAESDKKASG